MLTIKDQIATVLASIPLTKSAYRRRLYAIHARMMQRASNSWALPGRQARATRLEKRANDMLRQGLCKSLAKLDA